MAPVSRLVRNSKPNVDGVVARVSVDVWNAERYFLERVCGMGEDFSASHNFP